MPNDVDNDIQIFKLGLLYPSSVIEKNILSTLTQAQSVNIVSIIWQVGSIIILISIGYYIFYIIIVFISESLDKLVRVFRRAEEANIIDLNDEEFIDHP
jgi:hypothetical protein